MSSTTTVPSASPLATWLEQAITGLLTAPGPFHLPPGSGIGPIDLFSTRFAQTFTSDVKATINGTSYDNADLKAKLASVKGEFSNETATFNASVENDVSANNGQVGLLFQWSGQGANNSNTVIDIRAAKVSLDASVINDGGEPKINKVVIVSEGLVTAL